VEGDMLMFAQVMIVIVLSAAGLVAITLGARILWRIGSQTPKRMSAPADRGELQRLETAVESIAIEVERISESQRFMVSVLANRFPNPADDAARELPAPRAGQRPKTPH